MADAELSPASYVKYAFTDQHNLVVLFGAACFSAAYASPVPLLVGAGGELLWLLVGPRLPAFRDWVDAQLSEQYLARAETDLQSKLGQLQDSEARHFLAVSQSALELAAGAREHQAIGARDLQLASHRLLELRRTFLDYQLLARRLLTLIDTTPPVEVEREAARLQEEYAAARALTARMTIRNALTAAQKRQRQQRELIQISRTIETRQEVLGKALPRLKARLGEPGFQLSKELDAVLASIGSAQALELAVNELISSPTPSTIQ